MLAATLPENIIRLLPGQGESWRLAAADFRDYLEAPIPNREEANRFVIESVVYDGAPGEFLPAVLNADLHREREMECLALNIYHEARGESDNGMRAVGHVVLNRVSDPDFPDSVCDVIRERGTVAASGCQFSWWCDGRSDQPTNGRSWRASLQIAAEVFEAAMPDPTGGALWYHADYVSPDWGFRLARGPQIGRHVFYHRGDQIRQARAMPEPVTPSTGPAPSESAVSVLAAELADQFIEAMAPARKAQAAEPASKGHESETRDGGLRFLIQQVEPAAAPEPAERHPSGRDFPPGDSEALRHVPQING